ISDAVWRAKSCYRSFFRIFGAHALPKLFSRPLGIVALSRCCGLAYNSTAGGDERSPMNRYGSGHRGPIFRWRPEMRVLGLAFAVLLAVTVPIAAHANGARSNMGPANAGPAPGIVPVWDSGGSGRHPGVVGNHPTAGHVRQWNRGGVRPHWRQNWNGGWIPYGGPGCP